jgi:altronate dehydratase
MGGVITVLVLGLICAAIVYMYQRLSAAREVEKLNQELKMVEIREAQKHIDTIKTKTLKTVEEYQDARAEYRSRYPKPTSPNDKPSGSQG